jgi:hydrogenase expression/formation protein HypC
MCVGIPAQIVEIAAPERHSATVDVEGVRREVNTIMVDDEGIEVGDWVLLHVGFAMSKIDEEEAAETLAFMRVLGSVYDDEVDAFALELPARRDPT